MLGMITALTTTRQHHAIRFGEHTTTITIITTTLVTIAFMKTAWPNLLLILTDLGCLFGLSTGGSDYSS